MEPQTSERIELVVPGRPEYVVVVRLTAAAIAGRMGFSFDDVEDLKVAVGEVCSAAILDGGAELRVRFLVDREQLGVEVRHRSGAPRRHPQREAADEEDELNRLLVRVLMDEVGGGEEGGDRVTRMVKRLTPA